MRSTDNAGALRSDSGGELQPGELARIGTVLQSNQEDVSIGLALAGGEYSLATQCWGPQAAVSVAWSGGTPHNSGEFDMACAGDGAADQHRIRLPDYAPYLNFTVRAQGGVEVNFSIASADGEH